MRLSTFAIKTQIMLLYIILLAIGPFILNLVMHILYPDFLQLNHDINHNLAKAFVKGVMSIIIDLPILYHCAFRKPGTRWLLFSILFFIFSLFELILPLLGSAYFVFIDNKDFMGLLSEALIKQHIIYFPDQIKSVISTIIISNFLFSFAFILLIFFLFQLMKRNNLLQYRKTLKSDSSKKAYHNFKSVKNREDLKTVYRDLKKENPDIRKFLRFKYRQKSKKLKQLSSVTN